MDAFDHLFWEFIRKEFRLISALNGSSSSTNLILMFAKPGNQVSETPVELASAAQGLPAPQPLPPPSAALGYSAQALYAELVGALNEDGSGTATQARDCDINCDINCDRTRAGR